MKDIKNARFYIGTGVMFEDRRKTPYFFGATDYTLNWADKRLKLHLRPLDDMTEEEFRQFQYDCEKSWERAFDQFWFETVDYSVDLDLEVFTDSVLWLINKGFDIGLIPDKNVKHVRL